MRPQRGGCWAFCSVVGSTSGHQNRVLLHLLHSLPGTPLCGKKAVDGHPGLGPVTPAVGWSLPCASFLPLGPELRGSASMSQPAWGVPRQHSLWPLCAGSCRLSWGADRGLGPLACPQPLCWTSLSDVSTRGPALREVCPWACEARRCEGSVVVCSDLWCLTVLSPSLPHIPFSW